MKTKNFISAVALAWFGVFFIVWATNEMMIQPSPISVVIAVTFKWWAGLILLVTATVLLLKKK